MTSESSISSGRKNPLADKFYDVLKSYGVDFATGVPCGALKDIIYNLMHDEKITHVPATKESEAVGIAAGAYLAGKRPVAYMQNSGLFNCSNDIASLLVPYKIPVLLTVTWRGTEGEDAPQHLVTGKATCSLLDSLGVSYSVLKKENIEDVISASFRVLDEKSLPAVVLVKRRWYL